MTLSRAALIDPTTQPIRYQSVAPECEALLTGAELALLGAMSHLAII